MGRTTTTKGKCYVCKKEFGKTAMKNHLLKSHNKNEGNDNFFMIKVEALHDSDYWLYIQVNENTFLKDIDTFLRAIWLECCGHLSMFEINESIYESNIDISDMNLFRRVSEDMKKVKVKNVLTVGMIFGYDYDFGSTTRLKLQVIDKYSAEHTKENVSLLARNNIREHACEDCGKKAKNILMENDWSPPKCLCEECIINDEYEEYYIVDIINSPRMGVCDYIGSRDIYNL